MACMILLYQQAAKWAPKHHEWVELDPTLLQQLKKKEELQKNSQIVQTQLTKKSEKAADKAYLGQQTQIVDIQTVSKKLDQVIGKATAKSSSQSKQQEQARKEAKANSKPLANLGLTMIPPQTKTVQPDEPHWANVGSVGGDYVKGFKESDRTALNTVEYVYFSYMQRIRERFELELPRGNFRKQAQRVAFAGLGPETWLATSEKGGNEFSASLRAEIGALASISDQSDGYAVLRLTGTKVRDTLAKLIPIDVHPRAFKPGDVASTVASHIGVTLWRLDDAADGTPVFEIAVFRSLAGSFWHALA
ncbi:MAG: sarcosine oxidase subunit gamma, partial [Bdellovibrionota bacterium]